MRHAEHDGVSARIAERLEHAELEQRRIVLHQARGVGEVAERRRLAARSLECREPFLLRLHHLREDLLQLPGEGEILDAEGVQLESEGSRLGFSELEDAVAEGLALRQELFRGDSTDHFSQRELSEYIERLETVLHAVDRARRIDDGELCGQAHLHRDAIRREHFLTRDRDHAEPDVGGHDARVAGPIPIGAGKEHVGEAAEPLADPSLVLEDGDPLRWGHTK